MPLKIILTLLTAVLAVTSAAPALVPTIDISSVPPGTRLSKSVVDINENENEGFNDENSKIIVYPGGGGGGYPYPPFYPGGGRPPIIIIITPYGSRGPTGGGVLLRRPRKRSDDDAEDEDSNLLIDPTLGSASGSPSGRPFPKRGYVDEASKVLYYRPCVGYYPPPTFYPAPGKHSEDIDEDAKISLTQPGAGPRPRYPPWTYSPGNPLGWHQPSQKPGTLEVRSGKKKDKSGKKKGHPKRDKAEFKSGKTKAKAEAENEAVDWEDDDDFADENDDVKYTSIYLPSPYWDPHRPHILSK
ncbi:MAG: hypothetical protein JOS17DRAFT_772682 [Linnemannia elongata]|nr:MAG: hypothetical protein JOS17DRAFT_772682 [Linnemannia elongata]